MTLLMMLTSEPTTWTSSCCGDFKTALNQISAAVLHDLTMTLYFYLMEGVALYCYHRRAILGTRVVYDVLLADK
eukprot:SAG22_NODE_4706_length_1185_cov_4.361878_3_plen_73_part_01